MFLNKGHVREAHAASTIPEEHVAVIEKATKEELTASIYIRPGQKDMEQAVESIVVR